LQGAERTLICEMLNRSFGPFAKLCKDRFLRIAAIQGKVQECRA
jgi:hypothetical protein